MSPQLEQDLVPRCPDLWQLDLSQHQLPSSGDTSGGCSGGCFPGSAAVAATLPGWRVFGDRAVLINGALSSSSSSVWQSQWLGLGSGWVLRAP